MFTLIIAKWRDEEKAVAATEAALIFPILLTMLLSLFDAGNAVISAQKTIRSSQIVADLLARTNAVDDGELADAVLAGALSFEPLSSQSYAYDIISVRFDENGSPDIEWRETSGMAPLSDALSRASSLATPDGGVLMVVVEYEFKPSFAGFLFETIPMQEVAFSRGRNTAVVGRES